MVTVETGARLHVGFQNLSLAHDRLYGGIGIGLEEPRIRLVVSPAETVECPDSAVRPYVEDAVDVLGVSGARVEVIDRFGRHVGLGSGTQLALAGLLGVATAHEKDVDPRKVAPAMGRGGRSGVGVATFEGGGLVVDAGHLTERFTTRTPETGSWTVPEPLVQHSLPEEWRFLLVMPDVEAGRSGETEQASMESAVHGADPGIADDIATVLTRQLLPAVAEGRLEQFGTAVERIGRLNGTWYADEQGGVYRPPAGTLVTGLRESSAIVGTGQSSWGPTVYGITDEPRGERAVQTAKELLVSEEISGTVRLVAPRNCGATVDASH